MTALQAAGEKNKQLEYSSPQKFVLLGRVGGTNGLILMLTLTQEFVLIWKLRGKVFYPMLETAGLILCAIYPWASLTFPGNEVMWRQRLPGSKDRVIFPLSVWGTHFTTSPEPPEETLMSTCCWDPGGQGSWDHGKVSLPWSLTLSSCVLSLLLCSLLPQTQISGIHEGTSDWLCSCSKACSRLELGCVKGGRLCTPAENSLCIHTAHPPRTRSAAWVSVDISMPAFPVLSR